MEGTTNKGRTWNGYVCPGCRTVFRVHGDFDGTEVICPSCQESLKLPEQPEEVPPLVADPQPETAHPAPVAPQPLESGMADATGWFRDRQMLVKLALVLLVPLAVVGIAVMLLPDREEDIPDQVGVTDTEPSDSGQPADEPLTPEPAGTQAGPADVVEIPPAVRDPSSIPDDTAASPPPSLPEPVDLAENRPTRPEDEPPPLEEVPPVPDLPDPEEGLVAAIPDTPANQPSQPSTVPADDGSGLIHTVRRGDTLSSIARLYQVDLSEIRRANSLSGDLLRVDQRLLIPGATAPPEEKDESTAATPDPAPPETAVADEPAEKPEPPAATRRHTVVRGDTLIGIGRKYDCDPAEIKRLNKMRNDVIRLGEELLIPPPKQ